MYDTEKLESLVKEMDQKVNSLVTKIKGPLGGVDSLLITYFCKSFSRLEDNPHRDYVLQYRKMVEELGISKDDPLWEEDFLLKNSKDYYITPEERQAFEDWHNTLMDMIELCSQIELIINQQNPALS